MRILPAACLAALALSAPAEAQTAGPCTDDHRWSAADGSARFETCDGAQPVLTLSCEIGSDTITGTFASNETAGPARITARGETAELTVRPADGADANMAFDLPRAFLDPLARGVTADVTTPRETRTLHLDGSAAAIDLMLETCRAPAEPAEAAPQAGPADAAPPEGDPLASGTAPHDAVIDAFRAAWTAEAPPPPADDSPAPERCDALAGGPVTGFGSDVAVPFARIGDSGAALAACEAASEAEPDAPRHAFHAARAHLAQGESEAALERIRQASEAGYAPAANALALAILSGRTAPQPDEDTAALFTMAAEADYPPALVNLAIGNSGAGALADHATALDLAGRAARLGDPVAATLMGSMAFYGTGLPDDPGLATRWFKIGAARGDPDALLALTDLVGSDDPAWGRYRDAAIAAGHRTALVGAGLYAGGAIPAERMVAAIAAEPLRHSWDDGLLYLGDGRDSDGALFWTLMWPQRAGDDWRGADLDPLLAALAAHYDCADGRLYKITEQRLGCAR